MNEVWDLSILYKDFDDPAFTGDMKALDEAIAAVNALAGEAAGMEHSQLVHRFLQVQERVEELANKLFIFCSLRCSANTADTKANSLGDQLSAKLSGCAAANASLRRTVAELEDLLLRCTGLGLADMSDSAFHGLVYLADFDAYYAPAGDAGYVRFQYGCHNPDGTVTLRYADGNVTLRQDADRWVTASNILD